MEMTLKDVIDNSDLITSTECMSMEDMPKHNGLVAESEVAGGPYKQIIDNGDCFVYENKTHYKIADCGVVDLRKKK